jgi:hypothetical protein
MNGQNNIIALKDLYNYADLGKFEQNVEFWKEYHLSNQIFCL